MNNITSDNFEPLDFAKLINNTQCVLVLFKASWCGPCKSKDFKQNYEILKKNFEGYSKVITFLELDIDEFQELIEDKEYYDINVESVPYFVLFHKGKLIKDYKGTSCIQDIDDKFKELLGIGEQVNNMVEQQNTKQRTNNERTKTETGKVGRLTPDNLVNMITKTPCVLIKFTASWCTSCKGEEFKQNYEILKRNFAGYNNLIKFIELDVDEDNYLINDKTYYDINVDSVPYFKLAYKTEWRKNFSGGNCIEDIDKVLRNVINLETKK